jgi:hypothetical protein
VITRRCTHCEAEIEILDEAHISCPVCGLDPDLPSVRFEDGPAFFIGGDPRLPEPVAASARARCPEPGQTDGAAARRGIRM